MHPLLDLLGSPWRPTGAPKTRPSYPEASEEPPQDPQRDPQRAGDPSRSLKSFKKLAFFIGGLFKSEFTYHLASTKQQKKKVHFVEATRSKMDLRIVCFIEAK